MVIQVYFGLAVLIKLFDDAASFEFANKC